MAEIVVLAAHPALEHSRVNRRLIAAAKQIGERVAVRDLYALYPDFWIDAPAEQAALQDARLVVWLHPVHWYSMPPLMRLWVDEVFTFGWAYGPGGAALHDKDLWLVLSTGGSEASYQSEGYNRHPFEAFMPPYEQTALLTGMRLMPPLLLHGAHRLGDAALEAHAEAFAQRLRAYPRWPEFMGRLEEPTPHVPADERPLHPD